MNKIWSKVTEIFSYFWSLFPFTLLLQLVEKCSNSFLTRKYFVQFMTFEIYRCNVIKCLSTFHQNSSHRWLYVVLKWWEGSVVERKCAGGEKITGGNKTFICIFEHNFSFKSRLQTLRNTNEDIHIYSEASHDDINYDQTNPSQTQPCYAPKTDTPLTEWIKCNIIMIIINNNCVYNYNYWKS